MLVALEQLDEPSAKIQRLALECHICPYQTLKVDQLNQHQLAHKKPLNLIGYKCTFCDWYHKKKASVFDHLKLHTTEPEQFYEEVERNLITPARQSVTPVPESSAIAKENGHILYLHAGFMHSHLLFAVDARKTIEHHGNAWLCRYCSYQSKHRTTVVAHEESHLRRCDSGIFQCPLCDETSNSKLSLNIHHLNCHHNILRTRPHICHQCHACFFNDADLLRHLAHHNHSFAYKCTNCEYSVAYAEHLKLHQEIHASAEPSDSSIVCSVVNSMISTIELAEISHILP